MDTRIIHLQVSVDVRDEGRITTTVMEVVKQEHEC